MAGALARCGTLVLPLRLELSSQDSESSRQIRCRELVGESLPLDYGHCGSAWGG
jgi:hypothetical protein